MANVRGYRDARTVIYGRRPNPRRALFNKTRLYWLLIAAGVLVCYALLYQFLHWRKIQIAEVAVIGVKTLAADDVEQSVRLGLAGDRWRLLPRGNFLFFSPQPHERALLAALPALKSVEIKKYFPRTIEVAVEERKVWAIYCFREKVAAEPNAEQCFYTDEDGILFEPAPSASGNLILTIISDAPPRTIGEKALERTEIETLESYRAALDRIAGLKITGFEFKANAPKDVWAITRSGFSLVLARDDNPPRVAVVIKTVLAEEVKGQRARLQYLDARFGNRVFVKYKN